MAHHPTWPPHTKLSYVLENIETFETFETFELQYSHFAKIMTLGNHK